MKKDVAHTQLMLQDARLRMIAMTNPKRNPNTPSKVGDNVMLSTINIMIIHAGCNELLPRWASPFTITHQINPYAFRLDLPRTMEIYYVFHTSRLKPYKHDPIGKMEKVHPSLLMDTKSLKWKLY
jgi:hypothetical protein